MTYRLDNSEPTFLRLPPHSKNFQHVSRTQPIFLNRTTAFQQQTQGAPSLRPTNQREVDLRPLLGHANLASSFNTRTIHRSYPTQASNTRVFHFFHSSLRPVYQPPTSKMPPKRRKRVVKSKPTKRVKTVIAEQGTCKPLI